MARLSRDRDAIIISLLLLSIAFFTAILIDGWLPVLPLLIAGLIYGANLHFVTTILPTYLNMHHIYEDLNLGKIGATIGALISAIWVGHFSVTSNLIDKAFLVISAASLCLACALTICLILLARLRP